ncbi:hypothetical protein G7066_02905 [Leucobacter coleopterorum]|uniref:CU044_5270 family protein n=1 Tax=Leucobacter coleopterorum TaxID=2714933 RepID=A0ABX6JV73_9MICO|nr:hypothetical protein [Leucobacter coleopterorum]QIM17896.1 hypothetical protein G7066_02905 [Leucobacter coleopterorum]
MQQHNDRDMEMLRQLRGQETDMTDEAFVKGRARLERDMEASSHQSRAANARGSRSRRRRVPVKVRGAALVGFVAVAATAVVVSVALPGPQVTETPAAATPAAALLKKAAHNIEVSDPTLKPGQYLRLVKTTENISADYSDPAYFDESRTDENAYIDQGVHYRVGITQITYVPADPSGDWIQRRGDPKFLGLVRPLNDPRAEEIARTAAEGDSFLTRGSGTEEVLPGGMPPLTPDELAMPGAVADRAAEKALYEKAPHDPAALRKYIEDANASMVAYSDDDGNEIAAPESDIVKWLIPVLSNLAQPAGLRAAGLELLADLECTELVPDPSAPDDDTRVAVNLYCDEGDDSEAHYMVFEKKTGLVLGYRVIGPQGEVGSAVDINATVVDAVPERSAETW